MQSPEPRVVEIVLRAWGLKITLTQPWKEGKGGKPRQWFDVSVELSLLPPLPLTGVMGDTFPKINRDEWKDPW